jgi:glucuronosyltransferase
VYKYAAILDHPQVSNLLQSGRKFDLVIVEYFTTTALFTPIATVVNAPIIGIAPMIVLPWTNEVMGQESIVMPYVSDVLNNSTTLESFGIRITNYLFWMFLNYPLSWILNSKIQEMNELHYGLRKKSIVQSMANLSMILINNYPGVFLSTPRVPGIVDVAGIHVEDEKPLSQVIQ